MIPSKLQEPTGTYIQGRIRDSELQGFKWLLTTVFNFTNLPVAPSGMKHVIHKTRKLININSLGTEDETS